MPGEDAQPGQAYVRDIASSEAEVFGSNLDVVRLLRLLLLLLMMMMMMMMMISPSSRPHFKYIKS